MKWRAFAAESNFHAVCKVYLKRDTVLPFFDACSLLTAGIVSEMIIFFAGAQRIDQSQLSSCAIHCAIKTLGIGMLCGKLLRYDRVLGVS